MKIWWEEILPKWLPLLITELSSSNMTLTMRRIKCQISKINNLIWTMNNFSIWTIPEWINRIWINLLKIILAIDLWMLMSILIHLAKIYFKLLLKILKWSVKNNSKISDKLIISKIRLEYKISKIYSQELIWKWIQILKKNLLISWDT